MRQRCLRLLIDILHLVPTLSASLAMGLVTGTLTAHLQGHALRPELLFQCVLVVGLLCPPVWVSLSFTTGLAWVQLRDPRLSARRQSRWRAVLLMSIGLATPLFYFHVGRRLRASHHRRRGDHPIKRPPATSERPLFLPLIRTLSVP